MDEPHNHDALLRAVGAGLHNWSLVELQLSTLFATVSDPRFQNKAHTLFSAILSFDARLAVCDRLMSIEEGISELESEMWTKLSHRISKYYKKRHELAHFTIDNAGREPRISPFFNQDKIIRANQRYLTVSDIRQRSEKFLEIHKAIEWFNVEAFLRRVEFQQSPQLENVEPPLVPQLRELAALSLEERKQHPQSRRNRKK